MSDGKSEQATKKTITFRRLERIITDIPYGRVTVYKEPKGIVQVSVLRTFQGGDFPGDD